MLPFIVLVLYNYTHQHLAYSAQLHFCYYDPHFVAEEMEQGWNRNSRSVTEADVLQFPPVLL